MKNRYKISEEFIKNWDLKNKSKKILDAGAGEQRIKKFIKNNDYISQDFGEYKVNKDSVPFDFKGTWNRQWDSNRCDILSDITKIPLNDDSIDLVINLEVLEHLPEPVKAFHEFNRILKPGGTVLLTCPNFCTPHQNPFFFYSGFSKEFFLNLIPSQTNLEVTEYKEEGDIISAHINELNALKMGIDSFFIRLIYKLINKVYLKSIRILLFISKSPIPKSGSGFLVIYRKTIF